MTNTDARNIVPRYASEVTPVQKLCEAASRAIQELVVALPRDMAGQTEALAFLDDQRRQTYDYFADAPEWQR
jgi:hypothetical protein